MKDLQQGEFQEIHGQLKKGIFSVKFLKGFDNVRTSGMDM